MFIYLYISLYRRLYEFIWCVFFFFRFLFFFRFFFRFFFLFFRLFSFLSSFIKINTFWFLPPCVAFSFVRVAATRPWGNTRVQDFFRGSSSKYSKMQKGMCRKKEKNKKGTSLYTHIYIFCIIYSSTMVILTPS